MASCEIRKTYCYIEMTSAVFRLAASYLTSRTYATMLLRLLCLPTWILLDFILLSCYKAMYTAQLLYITSIPMFGQHYEIEALISEFEVSPAVWNV